MFEKIKLFFVVYIFDISEYLEYLYKFLLLNSIKYKIFVFIYILKKINKKFHNFDTLYFLIETNDLKFIKRMIDFCEYTDYGLYLALERSIDLNYFSIADYLISIGVDINYKNTYIMNDILRYSYDGWLNSIEYCLKNNANINKIFESTLQCVKTEKLWTMLIEYGYKYENLKEKRNQDYFIKIKNIIRRNKIKNICVR